MKQRIAQLIVVTALVLPVTLNMTGCKTKESATAAATARDKDIAQEVKTALNNDPATKGAQIEVQSMNGVVQLSGFTDSQQSKERAGQIAGTTPGVVRVYNNLLLPTGR